MESPFYWSQPAHPLYSSNFSVQPMHQNPVQPIHQYVQPIHQYPVQPMYQNPTGICKPAPKVVQIPVHFVGSDSVRSGSRVNNQKPEVNRSVLALKIQKAFRGFLVRKYVKKIVSIKKEVDEIERKLLRCETAELIRRNGKERLRVNETLMSLLLKLDSIRGIDSGVRDCRKAVIKKAISLQEKVDSIVSAGSETSAEEEKQYNGSDKIADSTENHEECGKSTNLDESSDEKTELGGVDDVAPAVETWVETEDRNGVTGTSPKWTMNDEKTKFGGVNDVAPAVMTLVENEDWDGVTGTSPKWKMNDEKTGFKGVDDVAQTTDASQNCTMKAEKTVWEGENGVAPVVETSEEIPASQDCTMNECVTEEGIEEEERGGGWVRVEDDDDEKKRNRELLEKMVEENGKMMRMMSELCKRNEVQTKMLNSLTQRVDQLEKAFVCDRLKNKKKKRNPAN